MLVLDTNHVSELGYGSPAGLRLRDRLLTAVEDTATTIITAEEQMRGWLAQIHRLADPHQQIPAYRRLQERIEFFASWTVLPWDTADVAGWVSFYWGQTPDELADGKTIGEAITREWLKVFSAAITNAPQAATP